MANLDDELRQAVQACDGVAVTKQAPGSDSALRQRRGGSIGLLVALLVLGGGALTLLLSSAEDSARYDVPVARYLAARERYVGKTARVEGTLLRGSLVKRDDPCEFRFTIHDKDRKGNELSVRYAQCIVPDNFRDAADVDIAAVVTGTLTPAGYFEATHIQPQCPSKYEEAQRRGEVMPHAPVQ
ncbi:MAG TPA: cytochrome c maturation protein CcmE [Polyangiaceae bacterium]|nr:cytochrome c maturation protein CcmE [Polyangiaceae bacterium]